MDIGVADGDTVSTSVGLEVDTIPVGPLDGYAVGTSVEMAKGSDNGDTVGLRLGMPLKVGV